MDIDLLFTKDNEAGLIFRENLVQKAAGLILDTESGILTLEYVDMSHLEFNIPVESDFYGSLEYCAQVHIGAIKNGNISQAYQVPFMFLDDPYRAEGAKNVRPHANPLAAFENFVKRCVNGQPVHRDDLGNEETMGCILGDASPMGLQFAPHLARRHAMEVSPKAAPVNTPRFRGPSAPGLGGGGGSTYTPPPRKTKDSSDEN